MMSFRNIFYVLILVLALADAAASRASIRGSLAAKRAGCSALFCPDHGAKKVSQQENTQHSMRQQIDSDNDGMDYEMLEETEVPKIQKQTMHQQTLNMNQVSQTGATKATRPLEQSHFNAYQLSAATQLANVNHLNFPNAEFSLGQKRPRTKENDVDLITAGNGGKTVLSALLSSNKFSSTNDSTMNDMETEMETFEYFAPNNQSFLQQNQVGQHEGNQVLQQNLQNQVVQVNQVVQNPQMIFNTFLQEADDLQIFGKDKKWKDRFTIYGPCFFDGDEFEEDSFKTLPNEVEQAVVKQKKTLEYLNLYVVFDNAGRFHGVARRLDDDDRNSDFNLVLDENMEVSHLTLDYAADAPTFTHMTWQTEGSKSLTLQEFYSTYCNNDGMGGRIETHVEQLDEPADLDRLIADKEYRAQQMDLFDWVRTRCGLTNTMKPEKILNILMAVKYGKPLPPIGVVNGNLKSESYVSDGGHRTTVASMLRNDVQVMP